MSTNKQQKSNIEDIPDDALADKVHKMIEQKRKENEANEERVVEKQYADQIKIFINASIISGIIILIYGFLGSMMSYLTLALQQSGGLNGVDLQGPPFHSTKLFNPCESSKEKILVL